MPYKQEQRICEYCQQGFTGNRNRRFCSHTCSERATARQQISECQHCHKTFSANPLRRSLFCSRACSDASRKPTPQHVCVKCGKFFHRKPSKKDVRFCSRECGNAFKRVTFHCAFCNRITQMKRCQSNRRRFCSIKCRQAYAGESRHEQCVRIALQELGIPYVQEKRVWRYSIDFYLPVLKIALEVDGVYWHRHEQEKDARRDAYLEKQGITTIRITDQVIDNHPSTTVLIGDMLAPYRQHQAPRVLQLRLSI